MKKRGLMSLLDPESPSFIGPADLIQRSKAGDREAFRLLIERYQRLVAMIVFRIVPHREDGRDLCQDVFLKVYEQLGTYRGEAEFSTWIGRIARNTALNHIKKKKVLAFSDLPHEAHLISAVTSFAPSPDYCYEEAVRNAQLEREVAALPEQDRSMLALFHQEGMNYEEVGRVLGLPVSSVKSHLFRARKRLRERLGAGAAREVS